MTAGQGNVTYKGITLPSGAPFGPGAANNGLSVDPVTGLIVFGNDPTFAPAGPAMLLSDREIDFNGAIIRLLDFTLAPEQLIMTLSGGNFGLGDANSGSTANFTLTPAALGGFPSLTLTSDPGFGGLPSRIELLDVPGTGFRLQNNLSVFEINDFASGANFFNADAVNLNFAFGDVTPSASGTKLFLDDANLLANIETAAAPMLLLNQLTGLYQLGDISSIANGLRMSIDATAGRYLIQDAGGEMLDLERASGLYSIGDIGQAVNGARLVVDDTNSVLRIDNAASNIGILINGVAGFTGTVAAPATITVNNGIVTNVA